MANARPPNSPAKGVGMGVDSSGGPVFDPTANVLDLVEKETKRGDDLRGMGDRLIEAQIERVKAEINCIKEVAKLRSKHDREQRKLEAKRLDSVRQVDVTTFNATVGEIRSILKSLSDTQSSTATSLQARVDATAATLAKQGADQAAEVMKRIAALELAAAQGIGKQAVVDPQMDRLTAMVEAMARAQASGVGKSEGFSASWGLLLGAVSLVAALTLIVSRFIK